MYWSERVVGIDVNLEMLSRATFPDLESRIQFVEGDVMKHPSRRIASTSSRL